ncbi:hypothetical protein Ddye_021552 [Dipteronia dyeriana]|uniref:Uncharacterized protein n=1 Tax=Dipteronia dyeriana TaxID=168575 RepID=A0AAD9U1Y8_9ROSI|nr:hypothetical protein Ddye_021552 [Dipteronia dyeriana]
MIKLKSPCFIFDGSHWVHDSSKRKIFNTMVTQLEETKAVESQESIGSLQQIYALNGRVVPSTLAKKGLMFMSATTKRKQVRAMLDIEATLNFISVDKAK